MNLKSPDIIYILADDLGFGDLTCYNPDSKVETPNLDKLAKQGIRFTDAHSSSAVSTPTRYGILTGRYAFRSRLKNGVLSGYSHSLIEPGRETVATFLKKMVIKRHVSANGISVWILGKRTLPEKLLTYHITLRSPPILMITLITANRSMEVHTILVSIIHSLSLLRWI